MALLVLEGSAQIIADIHIQGRKFDIITVILKQSVLHTVHGNVLTVNSLGRLELN